jgi:hypothetical protein
MSFYNTGNPVPSIDPRDLDDNAKHIDELTNSTFPTFVDRLGTTRRTLAGIEADADAATLRGDLAADDGASLVGFNYGSPNSVDETIEEVLREPYPALERYGGKGDYATDNLPALLDLLADGAKGITVNPGVYRFSDAISLPTGFKIKGAGAPILGFGTLDDKQYLRPGYKHLMPGSSFIFSGTGTLTVNMPQRIDEFATVRPCMRVFNNGLGSQNLEISGLAIIQDMDCFDAAGSVLKPGFNNLADYEAGPLLDDVDRTLFNDVVVFGYFSKAGTIISSVLGNADPDYTTFNGGSTMGKHGLAELGSNNGPATHGLSGTRLFGTGLYTLDHHARGSMTTPELTAYYATANTWSCWYVDGDVDAVTAEINGHYGYGVEIRTRANHPIRLDHASNFQLFGGVVELSPYGFTNSDVPTFVGSANVKRGIGFYGVRNNYLSTVFNSTFVGLIPVPVLVSGDPLNGRMGVFGKTTTGYAGTVIGSDGNVGNPSVQFTHDANNGSADWLVRMNSNLSDTLEIKHSSSGSVPMSITTGGVRVYSGGSRTELHEVGPGLTIASDAITVTRSLHALTPESGNTDDLATINGGVEGMELILRPASTAHVITLKRTGNIRLDGSTDKVLTGSLARIRLIFLGGLWSQLSAVVTNG